MPLVACHGMISWTAVAGRGSRTTSAGRRVAADWTLIRRPAACSITDLEATRIVLIRDLGKAAGCSVRAVGTRFRRYEWHVRWRSHRTTKILAGSRTRAARRRPGSMRLQCSRNSNYQWMIRSVQPPAWEPTRVQSINARAHVRRSVSEVAFGCALGSTSASVIERTCSRR